MSVWLSVHLSHKIYSETLGVIIWKFGENIWPTKQYTCNQWHYFVLGLRGMTPHICEKGEQIFFSQNRRSVFVRMYVAYQMKGFHQYYLKIIFFPLRQ